MRVNDIMVIYAFCILLVALSWVPAVFWVNPGTVGLGVTTTVAMFAAAIMHGASYLIVEGGAERIADWINRRLEL